MQAHTATAVLGIDLGTSSVKAMLLDPADGRVLGQADAAYPVDRPRPSWAETDPELWWRAVVAAVRNACGAAGSPPVAGIGLSGQMHGVVLCKDEAVPTRPAVLWADARATAELDLYRGLPPELRSRLANPLSPGMAGPVLAWFARHDAAALAAARFAVQPKDWLRARLTGTVAAEPADASGTLLYDVLDQGWSTTLLDALGLHRSGPDGGLLAPILPPILPTSGSVADRLTAAAASELGLDEGVPVAAGTGDTAAAMLGSGLVGLGEVQLTIGTGVQVVTPVTAPTADSVAAVVDPVTHLYRSATDDGWYAMAAGLSGGQTLDWVRGVLGAGWAELYASADRQPRPDDPVFLPHLVGERTPYLDPGMRGAWTRLDPRHDREALLHAALEGVAFAVADCVDALPGLPPAGVAGAGASRDLRLAGGGTTNPAWRQLLADVLGARLHAVEVPGASARGAALLGARAAGLDLGVIPSPATALVAQPGPLAQARRERRAAFLADLAALRASASAGQVRGATDVP